jgi:hypothetical protein
MRLIVPFLEIIKQFRFQVESGVPILLISILREPHEWESNPSSFALPPPA